MDEQQIQRQLGLRIKSFRKSKNLTQDDLSTIIGIEPANVSNIERGISFPSKTTLFALIEKCKIEPNFLLGFLYEGKEPYSTIDFDIIENIINLPEETKTHLNKLLQTLNK